MAADPRAIVAVGRDYPAGSHVSAHRHARSQLVYASAGVMRVSAAGGLWVVPPQRGLWVPAGEVHAIAMRGAVSMRTLYLDGRATAGLPARCAVVSVTPLLRELILRAIELGGSAVAGPAERLTAVILDELRAILGPLAAMPLHLPRGSDPRLLRVTGPLEREPGDNRPLSAWAREAGASARTLSRLFEKETGLGFAAWRQQARLMRSLEWLAEGRPVTAVALDLGYAGPSAFIQAFRRAFGTTPARYFRNRVVN